MRPFVFDPSGPRTVFGPGSLSEVGREVDSLGAKRVMVIHGRASTGVATAVGAHLGERLALRWGIVAQHVPVRLAESAREAATSASIDAIIAIGGGSAIGLGKAIALTHSVPLVAVPTTYSGSEQTAIYGLTDDHHKETGRDPRVRPRTVIYDPDLTLRLPMEITGPSAFNALAHAVEALWVPSANPIVSPVALESVRHIRAALPALRATPSDPASRSRLLLGAAMAGAVLGWTGTGLHHRICHVLGGMFNLVHADAHSVVLPHVVAFNTPAIPEQIFGLASALDVPLGGEATGLWDLAKECGVPTRLADLKGSAGALSRADLGAAAQEVVTEPNPRAATATDVLHLLERAFDGSRPSPAESQFVQERPPR